MCTRFCACKTVLVACPCMVEIMHGKEQTWRLLIITWCSSRNCTKLVLKTLAVKNGLSVLLSCTLYYFSLHDDYPSFLYTMQSIYITALPFLINWNEKLCSKSNILSMDNGLVPENSSSAAGYTLLNTIICLKTVKYLNIRLRQIY